jgi:2-amino-4-hydroxy-6-hydroxymethyldihydropteridine diphosphokinase
MARLAQIGLGSNLGDRKAILDGAVAQLRQTPELIVRSVSTYHETKPVGGPAGQGPFLNAAAVLETTLEPITLLHRLQEIEADAGRVRTVRWGERTLDLDVLLFGDEIIHTPELSVPHPRLGVRRFVLVPLEETTPDARDPLTGRSISELRANLDRRPSYLALKGWWEHPEKSPAYLRIVRELDGIGLSLRESLQLGDSHDCPLAVRFEPYELLERMVQWLDSRHWSGLGDQWLITDFSLREILLNVASHWTANWETQFWSLIARWNEQLPMPIQPTFLVYGIRSWGGPRDAEYNYLSRDLPCLRLESKAIDEEASEILTACAATRT